MGEVSAGQVGQHGHIFSTKGLLEESQLQLFTTHYCIGSINTYESSTLSPGRQKTLHECQTVNIFNFTLVE